MEAGAGQIDGHRPSERELRQAAIAARLVEVNQHLETLQAGEQPELSREELVAECHRLLPTWTTELTPSGLRVTLDETPPTRRTYRESSRFAERLRPFLPDDGMELEADEQQRLLRVRLTAADTDAGILGAGLEIERYLLENDLRP
jgi:hypothetical protein